ncbi:hypothetical protein LGM85_22500 [Burkholderia multivorans]|nr:hypothetical protein [Burkholderia multivorans]
MTSSPATHDHDPFLSLNFDLARGRRPWSLIRIAFAWIFSAFGPGCPTVFHFTACSATMMGNLILKIDILHDGELFREVP